MKKIATLATTLIVVFATPDALAVNTAVLQAPKYRKTTTKREGSWWDRAKAAVKRFVKQFKMSTGIGVKPGGKFVPVPLVGEKAPYLPLRRSGKARVVAFLRHVGCPFAEATARALRLAAKGYPAIEWVAVTHSPFTVFQKWARDIGGLPGIKVITDTTRRRYAQFGLGITGVGHFLGASATKALFQLARKGIFNRLPENGTRFQMAGTFAIDKSGKVRWRHIPVHGGDLPVLGKAARAVRFGK